MSEADDEYDATPDDELDGDDGEELPEEEEELDAAVGGWDASSYRSHEPKCQRVKKLCSQVREFGEEIIDVAELASIWISASTSFSDQRYRRFSGAHRWWYRRRQVVEKP